MSDQDGHVDRTLGRIEGKLDGISSSLSTLYLSHKDLESEHRDLRERITKVEKQLYLWAGAAAIISPVAYLVLAPLMKSFFR